MTAPSETGRASVLARLAGGAVLGALGAAVGYGLADTVDIESAPWADTLALSVAVALITIAAVSVGVLATRPSSIPRGCGVWQVITYLIAGLLMLAPMYGPGLSSESVVFGVILGLLALQTLANVMLWRAADEMFRRVMVESWALSFAVLQMALFIYAAAERLDLVSGLTAWGMIGVLMSFYLLASIIASLRRGLK